MPNTFVSLEQMNVLFHSERAEFAILKHLFVVFLNAQNECNSSHNECYQWFSTILLIAKCQKIHLSLMHKLFAYYFES